MAVPECEFVEVLLEVLRTHVVVHPDKPSFEEGPGILNVADVNLAINPALLMDNVLMGPEFVHLLVDLVAIRVEGLHVLDVLRDDPPDLVPTKLAED